MDPLPFWVACLALLFVGAVSLMVCVAHILRDWKYLHPISQASCLMIFADIQMILNFLPREIWIVMHRQLETSTWCTVSAGWTISSCVALAISASCIAYVTWQTIENKRVPLSVMLMWSSGGWVIGLSISLAFGLSDYLGPFQGIYCCTRTNNKPQVAAPIFIVYAMSVLSLTYFYRRAIQAADVVYSCSSRQIEMSGTPKANIPTLIPSTGPPAFRAAPPETKSSPGTLWIATTLNATTGARVSPIASSSIDIGTVGTTAGGFDAKPKFSPKDRIQDLVARRGKLMVIVFYACWSLTSANAFLSLCGATVPIESDMVGALFLKLQPIVDSIILTSSLAKARSARLRKQTRRETALRTGAPHSNGALSPASAR